MIQYLYREVFGMQKLTIDYEEYEKIVAAEKETQNKRISKKLRVLMLRYEGLDNKTISERLDISPTRITHLIGEYKRDGLEKYIQNKYGGNHRNMSKAEENEILDQFKIKAEAGQVVSAQEIKAAFDEKLGRDTGRGYVYMVLDRHNWRKVMPRSKHPKKADEEAIEASKKLKTQ